MSGTLNGVRYFGKTNRQRYEVVGTWSSERNEDVSVKHDGVEVFVADLRDKRTGSIYREGAYKVTQCGKSALFFGETAHSDAQRLADDLYWAWRAKWTGHN